MKTSYIAAVALLSSVFTPLSMAPAWADDVDHLDSVNLDNPDGPPLTPQEVCDEALKPAAASGFMTDPVNSSESGWVDDGPPTRGDNVGAPVPTGTPSAGPIVFNGTYYRNGQSPNVWGGGNATLHFPNSTQEYEQFQDQTNTTTTDCHVFKYAGNPNDPESQHLVEPPGLQTTGNTSVGHQTIQIENGFDTNAGPVDVPGQVVITLICISPNNATKGKPGTWTAKHGFTGSCTAASAAAGGTIPSNNAPTSDDGIVYFPH